MNFDAASIAVAAGGRVLADGPAGPIATDTRALAPGAWFVALVGDRFDGHAFVAAARAAGAAGVVVERVLDGEGGAVLVPDTTLALQDLGRAARARLRGPVVGITGSSGKTTTRALTALALSPLGAVHQTVGNLNNHLGVPISLCAAPEEAAVSVIEMGTSGPGEIRLLAEIGRPQVRLIVNVGPAHLEELGGLDGVAEEKGAMFATARAGDVACVNLDDERVRARPLPSGVRALGWGRDPLADVRLVRVALDPEAGLTRARWAVAGTPVDGVIPALGEHFAVNATAALAVAFALGVPAEAAVAALAAYAPVGMRQRVEPLPGGIVAINDAYNANPDSMAAALRTLAGLPGRRVAVLGDMLELGAAEARYHDEVATLAGDLGVDRLLLVGPRMARAATSLPEERVARAEEGLSLVDELAAWLRPGDRVLFKGSRGAAVERILHGLRERLADRAEERP